MDNGLSRYVCAASLCPEEFSRERVLALSEATVTGASKPRTIDLKVALVREPASPYRWADIGEALAKSHQFEEAKYCFQKAVERGSHKPDIRLRAANFYFTIGENAAVMRNLSVLLGDPGIEEYYPQIFLTYSRLGEPISSILSNGMPENRLAAQSYLRFLIGERHLSDSETAWDWLTKRNFQDSQLSADYLAFLIENGQASRAQDTWSSLSIVAEPDYRQSNWIFNGGFEQSLQPSPFDWHVDPTSDVRVRRTRSTAQNGTWSLEITFPGHENIDYHHVSQLAALPVGKWHLTAFLRTNGVTTDRGIGLRVSGNQLEAQTDQLTGTNDWIELGTTFTVRPATGVISIEVVRKPSMKLYNQIAGTAWLDSVQLSPVH